MAVRRIALMSIMTTGIALTGCQKDGDAGPPPVTPEQAAANPLLAITDTTQMEVGGETFTIALAIGPDTRLKGLGDVPEIPENRGMLFLFEEDTQLGFVMRDCLVDIDIAYLTASGTIGKMYTMTVEPRLEGESDGAYERRLTRYHSRFPARMALELRAGTLERLGVSVGDRVDIPDLEALKARVE